MEGDGVGQEAAVPGVISIDAAPRIRGGISFSSVISMLIIDRMGCRIRFLIYLQNRVLQYHLVRTSIPGDDAFHREVCSLKAMDDDYSKTVLSTDDNVRECLTG